MAEDTAGETRPLDRERVKNLRIVVRHECVAYYDSAVPRLQ